MTKSLNANDRFLGDPSSRWRGDEGLKWVEPGIWASLKVGFRPKLCHPEEDKQVAKAGLAASCRPGVG